ncbi:MAG: hypothetical protein ABI432_09460 [Flavobacteriales bacterium]
MKTLFTRALLVLASVLTLNYTRAAEPMNLKSPTALERSLDRALSKHLSFPVLEKGDMTGDVYVSFVIDKEGRIEVVSCASQNERLKDYVLRKLSRVDIGENPEGIWKTTHMHISFHPEKS